MLKIEQISPNVWVVYGEDRPDAARAFVRFQEYYENVLLKGKKGLVVRDIEDWWEEYRDKDETRLYYKFWAGFNVPGKVILDLIRTSEFRPGFSVKHFLTNPGRYPRWHNDETELLKLLEDLTVEQIQNGYFIGMWQGSTDVLEHEVAHAFFATVPAFKAEQTLNLGSLPPDIYKQLSTQLIDMGYHKDVVIDEMQAYLSTYVETLSDTFDSGHYTEHTPPFVETFQRYRKQFTPS